MFDYEAEGTKFKLCCYYNLPNAEEISTYLKDNQPPLVLIDARMVVSIRQIKTAVYNALILEKSGKMQSKSVYLEIMRCLSPDGRLSSTLKYVTINVETKDVIALTLNDTFPDVPGLSDPQPYNEEIAQTKIDYVVLRNIYRVTDEMLKFYTFEQIAINTNTIAVSDLVHVKTV